jgi:hypothetical protein
MLLVVAVCVGLLSCFGYVEYTRHNFIRSLFLVGYSTSTMGCPSAEMERNALAEADRLYINLFRAYRANLSRNTRVHLAWLLITRESPDYVAFAQQNINAVPWPEVRVWRFRYNDKALTPKYRDRILELLLLSPTSEAQLFAAHWYHGLGNLEESEDCYYAAMNNGEFWDALDAADALVNSTRYHQDAVNHLLSVVRDTDVSRAAYSLLDLYHVRQELAPLVEACEKDPGGTSRKRLVERLTQIIKEHEQGKRGKESRVKTPPGIPRYCATQMDPIQALRHE